MLQNKQDVTKSSKLAFDKRSGTDTAQLLQAVVFCLLMNQRV
jgi:hypothetical protein